MRRFIEKMENNLKECLVNQRSVSSNKLIRGWNNYLFLKSIDNDDMRDLLRNIRAQMNDIENEYEEKYEGRTARRVERL